ncbi:MAG: Ldh family oxidoreductase [Alphaproteobacteria bacterium]
MSVHRFSSAVLRRYVLDILVAHDVDNESSESVAEVLVWSDMVGRRNFGLHRLPILLRRVQEGVLSKTCDPSVERIAPGAARIDGDNGFGHHIGRMAMRHAIQIARENGVGVVTVHESNFFGAGAYFVNQAAEAGMIGLALSNSFPKVAAHGGVNPVLGTNPLAFGAPRRNGESLLFDMATSALAGSTVRSHISAGDQLPAGAAIDDGGGTTVDPNKIKEGALLPFGGAKGYGLALMVEMLAGVLSGAGVSNGVASMYADFTQGGHNGHFMLAIDITRWLTQEDYFDRFEALIATIEASGSGNEVLLPGEIRWRNYRDAAVHGISVPAELCSTLSSISDPLGVEAPWVAA